MKNNPVLEKNRVYRDRVIPGSACISAVSVTLPAGKTGCDDSTDKLLLLQFAAAW